jgi:hypothetical protein
MGLSSQGYNGHIFGILNFGCPTALYGKNLVSIIVLIVCKSRSKKQPFMVTKMFPWESDDTGEEATGF